VAIATKNALRRITLPAYKSAATVSHSIPAATKGVVAPRRSSNEEICIMPALRHSLVATSLLKLFLQGNPNPQLYQTMGSSFNYEITNLPEPKNVSILSLNG
jgi:hypothetical protein